MSRRRNSPLDLNSASNQHPSQMAQTNIENALSKLAQGKVAITGSTGFVGSHLCTRIMSAGIKPNLLVRKTSDPELVSEFKSRGAKIFYGDVSDKDAVEKALDGCSHVFHIAALFREAKHDDARYYEVNVEGTRNVLDACAAQNVERLAHCSTVGVHSHIPNPPANESEEYRPGDIYQETKCEGEKLAAEYFKAGKVNGVVIRPAMIWGEGDKRMLKLFRGVKKRSFPIIGDGRTMTHWVYVHDLVDGFILAATKPEALGQTYILAGKRAASISELVETVADCAGVKPLPVKVPARPVQILGDITETVCRPLGVEPPIYRRRVDFFTKDRHFDIGKAEKELGYVPRLSFKEEVSNIYNWYNQQGWLQ